MAISSIAVYCGANVGSDSRYAAAARALGERLAGEDVMIVYGGGHIGMMGEVANASISSGGKVVGVITRELMNLELGHQDLAELHVVETMHERKAMMAEMSDGFVALPGGWGTLDEIFEMMTWSQLGIHNKPCGFLNTAGFFDGLFRFLDDLVANGMVKQAHRDMLLIEADEARLMDRMRSYQPQVISKI